MIIENVPALAREAQKKMQDYKNIALHLRGIIRAEAVEGIDLTSQQRQAALDALVALETTANDTTAYMAVRNATEPVDPVE